MAHRSIDIAQRILQRSTELSVDRTLTPMQLLKLTYLAHGWMLGIVGRPLTTDNAHAWRYGPVYPSLYQAIRQYRSDPVNAVPGAACVTLDDEESQIIDEVVRVYGPMSGIELSRLTHLPQSPWSRTWEYLGQSSVISNDLIEQYYRDQYRQSQAPAAAA